MFTALAIVIFVSATLAIGIVLGVAITLGAAKPHLQVVTDTATPAIAISHLNRDPSRPSVTVKRAA
jgi:hypothetical protein